MTTRSVSASRAWIDPQAAMSWPAPFSWYEHVGRSSATTRDAITRQSRLIRLMRDAHSVTLEGMHERAMVRFDFVLQDEPRSLVDFHMAAGLLAARRILGQLDAAPLEVRFTHAEPRGVALFERFFNAPLQFGADINGFVVDSALIDLPLPTANQMMRRVFEHRAREALEALPAIDDFVQLVRERIEAELPDGNTNASRVAETLKISQRTLHRRLQTEGISYQELLDKLVSAGAASSRVAQAQHQRSGCAGRFRAAERVSSCVQELDQRDTRRVPGALRVVEKHAAAGTDQHATRASVAHRCCGRGELSACAVHKVPTRVRIVPAQFT